MAPTKKKAHKRKAAPTPPPPSAPPARKQLARGAKFTPSPPKNRNTSRGGRGQGRKKNRPTSATNQKKSKTKDDACVPDQDDEEEEEDEELTGVEKEEDVHTTDEMDRIKHELKTARKELEILKHTSGFSETTVTATEMKIKGHVKHQMFRKCKLVGDMRTLDQVGKKAMTHMNMEKERRDAFWSACKQTVLKALTQQRNAAIQAVKDKWHGEHNCSCVI